MIIRLSDSDGDPVAILAASVMAVSTGRLAGPTDGADPLIVTIVHTLGGPLIVADPIGVVVVLWEQTLAAAPASQPLAQAALIGWQAQYPEIDTSGLLPGAAPWTPQPLSKDIEP